MARHAAMVLDPLRTGALRKAIRKVVKKGDIVCDIGAGLGLLSFFALAAGAEHVYAIDCDAESLDVAIGFAKKSGVAERISFIEGHSSDVYIGEEADVLICETIGSAAFDENILATLADAKKRLLRRGGKIVPAAVELWGAPATFEIPTGPSAAIETAVVRKEDLLSKPKRLAKVLTSKKLAPKLHIRSFFAAAKPGWLSGIALWPKIEWAGGCETDASPLKRLTHWKQCILPGQPRNVKSGERIRFELIIGPDPADPKKQTEVLWKLN
jgi:predicted RNA methylase